MISSMKHLLYSLIVLIGLVSCEGQEDPTVDNGREANGPVVYGGSLNLCQDEKFQTFYPPSVVDLNSMNIVTQVFEGLVKFNPQTMQVEPSLAESWTVSSDGLVYTFKLRSGANFHDDPCFDGGKGRAVTADDVRFTFELLCENTAHNSNFANLFQDRLQGANAYYAGEAATVSGIQVVDAQTVSLTLEESRSSFLYTLANPATSILAPEAVEQYGNKAYVGTGPFRYESSCDTEKELVLLRNDAYSIMDSFGNTLPYLDSIRFSFVNSKNTQLEQFRNDELDMINGLPSEKIKEVVKQHIADFSNKPPKYILGRSPEMMTQFYEFNLTKEVFKDSRVRKAFSYAINRQKIYRDILMEEAFGPGHHGITPPSFRTYDIDKIPGYSYDPDQARELMAMAGYPAGDGFPTITIELNSGGTRNSRVAFEIQKQLSEVLGINVDIEVVPFAQKLEDAKYGRADIFRSAWVADFPSPENFLWIFYGKNVPTDLAAPSWPNTARYVNPEFDALFEQGIAATSEEDRNAAFMAAETLMMQDAPIIVLWYSENFRLRRADVRNFYSNPMNYLDCSRVYIKAPEKEVEQDGH